MSILHPQQRFHRIWEISPTILVQQGIRGVILDVDNTLTTHDNPLPSPEVLGWLAEAKTMGLDCLVLSNNSPERVAPFAEGLGLRWEANGKKPLPFGYRRGCRKLGLAPKEVVSIGDQLFTDVLGARLTGVYSIFVDPIEPEQGWFFRLKRRLEQPLLRRFERKRNR